MFRALLIAAGLALAGFAAASADRTAEDAEQFVQANAQEIISILQEMKSGERSVAEVKQDFRARIDELADVGRITNFVLGRYLRTAEEETLDEFRRVFREFAINVYERELRNYAGQDLEVTGSITRGPGDWIVRSTVSGGPEGKTYDVNWRVLETDGDLKVLDAQVMGVWLAQSQRDQITSIIGNAGGDVNAAISVLRERICEQEAAAQASQ